MNNKMIFKTIFLAFLLLIVACTNFSKGKEEISAVLYSFKTDQYESKELTEKTCTKPHMMSFSLEIKNISKQPIFIPIKTLLDTTYKSNFYFLYQGKILHPLTNHTFSNCIIPSGETMKIQLTLFPIDFTENDLAPPTNDSSLFSRIELKYRSCVGDSSIQIKKIHNINILKK